MARQALGRGLEALIGSEAGGVAQGVQEIPLERVVPGSYQARKGMDPESLEELAQSIRVHGVVQPIVVRPSGDRYELVVGERRWRAAQLAGVRAIPAVVRELDERATMELGLIENLQREDLNPLDEAEAYRRLMDEFGMTQEQVAEAVGRRRSTVANMVRVLSLPAPVKEWIRSGQLGAGHAKVLAGLGGASDQIALARMAVGRGWSVRQLEKEVQARRGQRAGVEEDGTRHKEGDGVRDRASAPAGDLAGDVQDVLEALQRFLGTKVRCRPGKGRGVLEIEYYGEDDLRRILERVAAQLASNEEGREQGGL